METDIQLPAGLSPRARLAAAARRAAAADPDVIEVREPSGAAAVAGGGFEVTLALVTRMVPLEALAVRLRERVTAAAAQIPGAAVSNVKVAIVDVWSPDEEAPAVRAVAGAAAAVDAAARDEGRTDTLPPAGAASPAVGGAG